MPRIQVNVPHELDRETAIERLRLVSEKIKVQYGSQISKLVEEWREDSVDFAITASGISVKGTVLVLHQTVQVESSVPLVALPFRGMIEAQIRKSIIEAFE